MSKGETTMALQLSKSELVRMAKKAESLQKRVQRATEKADDVIDRVVRTTEVGATAFGFGVVQGRYGAIEVAGIPIDLGAAVLGHIGGFMGVGGRNAQHLHAFADGALASYAVTMGRGAGASWRQKAVTSGQVDQLPPGAKGSGDILTREEMADIRG
jgi:hypothetical protein